MKTMYLDVGNGNYSVGLCCWDADKGSRKEAVFIGKGRVEYDYGSDDPKYYAMSWAKDAWVMGSARNILYRVAVSNGVETTFVLVKVASKPEAFIEYMPQQTMVDLDTLSMGEPK